MTISQQGDLTHVTQAVQYLSVRKLKVRKDNPRRVTKSRLKNLCKSIKDNPDYFETRPILCNKNFEIFAGTQRFLAAKRVGMKAVPAVVMDIPEARQREIMLRDNVHSGVFDIPKLEFFDSTLLSKVGLTKADIPSLEFGTTHLEVSDDGFEETAELKKIKKPKTKPGDVVILGRHKLICGDCTDPAIVKKLFGKERTMMIYSDPPYNLRGGVDYNKGFSGKCKYGANVHDNRSDSEYTEFLRKSLVNALNVSKSDVHVFCFCDESYVWLVQTLYRELGITNKRLCFWVKNSINPIPSNAFANWPLVKLRGL